ncbi:MAG: type II CAAX prenyl endopeptidase Rce1 family protein [Vicinamibacterales bacterium]
MPIRPGERARSLLETLLCSGFPTQLALAGLLAAAGRAPFSPDGNLVPEYVFVLSIADAIVVVGLVVLLLRLRGEDPGRVFFARGRPVREIALGLALVPAVFVVAVGMLALIHAFVPSLRNVPVNPLESLLQSPGDAAVFAGVAFVSGGLREEIQRAFILHRFDQHLGGGLLGLVLFSVIFGAGHIIQGWDAVVTTASLGAVWGAIYLVRRNVLAAIVSHTGFDLVQIWQYMVFGG